MKALSKRLGGGLFLFFFLLPLFGRGQEGGSQPPDLQVCLGKGYTLASSTDAAGTTPVTYAWFENGTDMGSAYNTASVSIPAGKPAGTYYYVRVASNDACAGVSSNTYTVVVNPLPTDLSLTANPAVICNGQFSTLTASAANGASYRVNTSDWQTSETFNITPTSNTSYTLYVQTSAGCSATKTNAAAVAVNLLPAAPTNASSNARCGPGTVSYSASVLTGETIDWYTATKGGSTLTGSYGTLSFVFSIAKSTVFHAEARNTTTGCVSPVRRAVYGYAEEPAVNGQAVNSCPCATGLQSLCGICQPRVSSTQCTSMTSPYHLSEGKVAGYWESTFPCSDYCYDKYYAYWNIIGGSTIRFCQCDDCCN